MKEAWIELDDKLFELTIRQKDLDVFQFVLVFNNCPDATSLAGTFQVSSSSSCSQL